MKYKLLFVICLAILAISTVGGILLLRPVQSSVVDITQNGMLVKSFNLFEMEDQTFDIEHEGRKNTIQIKNKKIRILEADCPDQTCVKMGWLDSVIPIVCLPNKLVIEFSDEQSEADGMVQ